jgi:hypothetical protein
VFALAAQQFNVWILVRRTNPASLKYIGVAGYTPKPIDCKAKTADTDVQQYQLAGLVVNPHRWPDAFSQNRRQDAVEKWEEFRTAQGLSPGSPAARYDVDDDPKSPHCGCVRHEGCYVHGDYDLYDIVLPEHPRGNLAAVETLHGSPHRRGPRVAPVMDFINRNIGAPVVQHGGEMQYADHSDQSIDVFGPQGQQCTILNQFSVRAWYQNTFQGRRPLG